MGTNIEGEWQAVMAVVDRCFDTLQTDCDRIYVTIKADYRKAARNRLQSKVRSVEAKLV